MADGQVTGGLVRATERIKTGDFEHREVTVELHFNVLDGRDYRDLFDNTAVETLEKVQTMLGRSKTVARQTARSLARPPRVTQVVETESANTTAVIAALGQTDVNHAVSVTSDPEAAAKASAVDAASMENVGELPLESASGDKAKLSGSAQDAGNSSQLHSTGLDPAAIDSGSDEWTATRDITDAMMMESITARNARLIEVHKEKGTKMIRDLIAKYIPAGKPAREIPKDKRQQFLTDLDALK